MYNFMIHTQTYVHNLVNVLVNFQKAVALKINFLK